MKLYIYRLEGCKICMRRQPFHNALAKIMESSGIEVQGVMFGMISGKRVEPLPQHDKLCRKDNDPMKYQAPVYILEIDDTDVKLPDVGNYSSPEDYANVVLQIAESVANGAEQ